MKLYAIYFILLNVFFIGKGMTNEEFYCGRINDSDKFSMKFKMTTDSNNQALIKKEDKILDVIFDGIEKSKGELASREDILSHLKRLKQGTSFCVKGLIDNDSITV